MFVLNFAFSFYFGSKIMCLDLVSYNNLDSGLAVVGLSSFEALSFCFVLESGKMGLDQADQHCTLCVHVYSCLTTIAKLQKKGCQPSIQTNHPLYILINQVTLVFLLRLVMHAPCLEQLHGCLFQPLYTSCYSSVHWQICLQCLLTFRMGSPRI